MDIQRRIEHSRKIKAPSNCFGTALYIMGMMQEDTVHSLIGTHYERDIERLEVLPKPEMFSLAIFRRGKSNFIDHLAIVTGLNPTLLTQRDVLLDFRGKFVENESLEETVKRYNKYYEYLNCDLITKIEYRRILNCS